VNPEPRNLAASIHQRLLNAAHKSGRQFNELLQYYALERFLYRLSASPHVERFVLKGALLLRAWRAPDARPTLDIDLLGRMPNEVEAVANVMRDVCRQTVIPDGLVFDPDGLRGTPIAEDAVYEGVRVNFQGHLGNARLAMQVDVGFGDVVTPAPAFVDLPPTLDLPAPRLRAYPRETTIAEKIQILAKLGLLTSRMKDVYDLWLLSRSFDFAGALLTDAIRETFAHRQTTPSPIAVAFTPAFAQDSAKQNQWAAFARRLPNSPTLAEAHAQVVCFAVPLLRSLAGELPIPGRWTAPGPWETSAP
jgi:predicted nucleotidyltransferase component of viral defense system